MEYSALHELIASLEYGTRLHIGVLFFDDFDDEIFKLEHPRTIHMGEVCWYFKNMENGTRKCYRCRKMAIQKAQREGKAFGGYCINGVYEYTRPVMIGNQCAAIIYIGNILHKDGLDQRLVHRLGEDSPLLDTMEKNFDEQKCRKVGQVIESYIRALWEIKPKRKKEKESPLIKNIKGYVIANLMFDIHLSDVAHLFHYNDQYLGRLFKRETGESFTEYVNKRRVNLSLEYLEGNMNITNIASCVGFQNVTYFNRMFKRYIGESPSEYRKKRRKNDE